VENADESVNDDAITLPAADARLLGRIEAKLDIALVTLDAIRDQADRENADLHRRIDAQEARLRALEEANAKRTGKLQAIAWLSGLGGTLVGGLLSKLFKE
jgi:hypothetical protein